MPPSAGISGSGHRSRGAKTPYSQFPAYGPRAFMSDDDNTGRSNRVYRSQMLELRAASRQRTMPPSLEARAQESGALAPQDKGFVATYQPGGQVMKMLRPTLFVAAAAFVMAIAAQAQDSPQRKELRRVDLSGAQGMEVISSISEFKPGDELPRHLHHGVEAGYVVQGAMVQNTGQPPTMLATGAPILNLRDVVHGGFKVVGPGNLILFTVHTVDKGKPLYDWAK